MQKRLHLANGMQVTLTHDPRAARAAALFHLRAGSHHEPHAWPGLAHLFEHVVFAGSQDYQDEQRLMSWAQAEGARLNATTLPTATTWFFDITAAKLAEGFARLVDMLAQPLLSRESIAREIAVIDAEFRMLSTDADTLCEAALGAAFASPRALSRFHVGNLTHFGDDIAALQRALQTYHQELFHGDNLTLWLSGPQSLEELTALAERYAGCFPAGKGLPSPVTEPLNLQAERTFSLRNDGAPRLQLSFRLPETHRQQASILTLLRQLLVDEAQHSLLAALRLLGDSDTLQLLMPYCSDNGSIVTAEIVLNSTHPQTAARVEAIFNHWLRQLSTLSLAQLNHYASLATRQFLLLAPVDKLRATAFGFPPIERANAELLADWQGLLSQLTAENVTRLWISPAAKHGTANLQGFSLSLAPMRLPTALKVDLPALAFYPRDATPLMPAYPAENISLPQRASEFADGVLILSPAAASPLTTRWAYRIQACLQAIIGHCAHQAGHLSFERFQGQWLLQLSGTHQVIITTLDALLTELNALPDPLLAQGERQYVQAEKALENEIAIRCLLNQLPRLLSGESAAATHEKTLPQLNWNAALYGGDSALWQGVSHLLSRFPGRVNAGNTQAMTPTPTRSEYPFTTTGDDAAVLLFCPLTEQTAACHAAWRILASLFEPRFFQRLRVELNLGYVVTCRFMQSAGESGMMFAVQSPTHATEQIISQIERFIADMSPVVFALSAADFEAKCAALQQQLDANHASPLEQSREHWLQHHSFSSPPTFDAIAGLTLTQLHHFQQQFAQDKSRRWLLSNRKPSL